VCCYKKAKFLKMGLVSSGVIKNSMSHTKCGKSIIGKTFITKISSTLDLSNSIPELSICDDSFLFLHPKVNTNVEFIVTDLNSYRTPMGYWAHISIKFLNDIDIENFTIPRDNYNQHCIDYISNDKICLTGCYGAIVLGPRCTKNFINIKKLSQCGDYDYNVSATYNINTTEMI
jgi:hypothetical protein